MKRKLVAIGIIFVLSIGTFSGCTQDMKKQLKHTESGYIGLNRTVTLYDGQGKPIKQWSGRFKVEINGSTASFIADGKEVKISGTFIIEEK